MCGNMVSSIDNHGADIVKELGNIAKMLKNIETNTNRIEMAINGQRNLKPKEKHSMTGRLTVEDDDNIRSQLDTIIEQLEVLKFK